MAATLRAYADDMRAKRLLKAEEMGQKMAVKIAGVLAGCFIPSMMIVIMAPLVHDAMEKFFK